MADAKETHNIDQAVASMGTIGRGLANMYRSLTANDVPKVQAAQIVGQYGHGMATCILQAPKNQLCPHGYEGGADCHICSVD